MHELSLAQNIVDLVNTSVSEQDSHRVRNVSIKIGVMAGVVPDSLSFSFEAITAGTPLGQTKLQIESVPYCIQCHACGTLSENEWGGSQCPACASRNTAVVSGTELIVQSIELQDAIPVVL